MSLSHVSTLSQKSADCHMSRLSVLCFRLPRHENARVRQKMQSHCDSATSATAKIWSNGPVCAIKGQRMFKVVGLHRKRSAGNWHWFASRKVVLKIHQDTMSLTSKATSTKIRNDVQIVPQGVRFVYIVLGCSWEATRVNVDKGLVMSHNHDALQWMDTQNYFQHAIAAIYSWTPHVRWCSQHVCM